MRIKASLLATTAIAVAASGANAEASQFYVSIFGGGNWVEDDSAHLSINAGSTTFALSEDPDAGYVYGGAIGMNLGQYVKGFRAEVEVSFRANDINGTFQSQTSLANTSGVIDADTSTLAVMANVWYDINIDPVIRPYVGGGIGWARVAANGTLYATTPTTGVRFDDDSNGFAWQIGAGVNFVVTEDAVFSVGYRYFDGPEINRSILPLNVANPLAHDLANSNQSLIVEVRLGM